MQTWLLGIQCECGFWFCVQDRCLEMFLLLTVLLAPLVLLNVGVVQPLEVFQSYLMGQRRPAIFGLVSPLKVVTDFLCQWTPLEVSRGEQVAKKTMEG